MAKKSKELGSKHTEGDAFIGEHTGSATLINVNDTCKDDNSSTKKQSKIQKN